MRLSTGIGGATWGPDDHIIVGSLVGGLLRVPATGGRPEQLTTPDVARGESSHRWPWIIPEHELVVFTTGTDDASSSQLAVLSLPTGEITRLGLAGTNIRYLASRHLVYVNDAGDLRAVRFDPDQIAVRGEPVTLVEDVLVKARGAANVSISDTGHLIYMTDAVTGAAEGSVVWVDRTGEATPVFDEEIVRGHHPRLSPDGTRLVVEHRSEGDLYIWDLERGFNTRWAEEGADMVPSWTPDGESVTFASTRSGGRIRFYTRPAGPSGQPRLILGEEGLLAPLDWSPDGQRLVYHAFDGETNRDVWVLDQGTPTPFLVTEVNELVPRLSPNGEWLAYLSDQSGERRVYLQPFPEGGPAIPVSPGLGTEPAWSRDGRELFYRNGSQMLAVVVGSGSEFSVSRPALLFEAPFLMDPFGAGFPNYDVSPDGRRFLMVAESPEDATPQIRVVLNWHHELLERVPVD